MSRSSAKRKPSLSLTPEQEAFLDDGLAQTEQPAAAAAAQLASPPPAPVSPSSPSPSLSPRPEPVRITHAKAEDLQLGPLPRSHRLQASGKVVRRVTGFVSFDLGKRFEDYLEVEERTASYVLERALKAWLDSRQ